MGFEHPYILHLVFAFTALHLATSRPDQRDEYMAISERHYEAALPVVTSELAKLNPKHCHAICMAVQLVCLIHCARGPQPGEFLAFGEGGRSEWLIMFRGIRTTREFMNTKYLRVKVPERPVPLYDFPPKYETALADLRDWVDHVSVMGDDERDANLHAVDELAKCYHARYGGTESELLLVFAWLYKMSDEYLRRLQDLEPVPLVIFAWFTVLLGDMERLWYV
ncbi:hypothetical protein K504DRAFT_462304 [Pleomassaria siparia CBS 279.74]|uniref:C6 zinc finger domain-containing protein n=1 Tax=Pleomassaria siparia CBS 279.74 TaxID=1314801 RepID=A0A6G1KLZ1_9PLEO|nr:hypothetical protein K504DRAFT_462304 [Pleomassaria siparia CBS 279.74]